jgi:hypothetical protein
VLGRVAHRGLEAGVQALQRIGDGHRTKRERWLGLDVDVPSGVNDTGRG